MRHGLMQKEFIHLNPQIKNDKLEIGKLVRSITIWYIGKVGCLKVFENVIERPTRSFLGFGQQLCIIS